MTAGPQTAAGSSFSSSRWTTFLAGGLIVLATVAAYCNSFGGPFVLDDEVAIARNPTIRELWPLWKPLCPPNNGVTVTGRPLLNVSLAVNYAFGGLDVGGYHAFNLAIHVLAALLLFGVLRRTFVLPDLGNTRSVAATPLALGIALLWALHPLQTESVTYIVQRAESLVGLFYLLTLYCFIRGASSGRGPYWYAAAVLACLLGMASKEIMVSAPVIVLLYDRAFLAGSFREAWRRRYRVYLALAGTWLLLAYLVIAAGNRGGSAGFGAGVGSWAYLCTQFGAIIHYLRLCVWPRPLLLDYGTETVPITLQIVPDAMLVALLGLATILSLWRWPKIGFLGAWFFAILAPTSSIVPVATQVIAEHRMYLPLAAVITVVTCGGYLAGWELVHRGLLSRRAAGVLAGCATAAAALTLGALTFRRNADYHTALSIWQDTVAKAPHNARAHNNLGRPLIGCGQIADAVAEYRKALMIQPDYVDARYNLGTALVSLGELDAAIAEFRQVLAHEPDDVGAHNNLGLALANCGQLKEAAAQFRQVLAVRPEHAEAHNNLANALAKQGRGDEAVFHYQEALRIQPDYSDAHNNLGSALAAGRRLDEAITHYRRALALRPAYPEAHNNFGNALVRQRRFDEAIDHFQKALDAKPNYEKARINLANAVARREKALAALAERRKALRRRPDDLTLLNDTAWLLATDPNASLRNGTEAVEFALRADRLAGGKQASVLDTLAAAYAEAGRYREAVETARKALESATQQGNNALADALRARIDLYEAGTPYRQTLTAGH
jgi:protein O-mannosyl-transferase